MTHRFRIAGLLGVGCTLGVAAVALGASWSNFDAAFPGLPCNDGWSACVVDGTIVSPGMVLDGGARPHPADMRVGFFDFDPLPGFSPFTGLSSYTGEEAVADAEPPDRQQPAVRPASNDEPAPRRKPDTGHAAAAPADDDYASDPPPVPVTRPAEPGTTARTTPEPAPPAATPAVASVRPTTATRAEPTGEVLNYTPPPRNPTASSLPPPTTAPPTTARTTVPAATPPPVTTPPVAPPATKPPSQDAVAAASPSPAAAKPPPDVPATCDDLVALEVPAMMGQLGAGRRKCLEGLMASASVQTGKNKISRVLIADAEARGDRQDWERLMKRHLEDIDRSDPNLCLKYALHLSRGGAGRANGVIRWADYALENKQQWSGPTYTKNVYGLYKLRASAANSLWQAAEKKFVDEHNDDNEGKATRYRGMTKDYSREWLDYARASGGDIKAPLSLCVSAAGNKEFCEG